MKEHLRFLGGRGEGYEVKATTANPKKRNSFTVCNLVANHLTNKRYIWGKFNQIKLHAPPENKPKIIKPK